MENIPIFYQGSSIALALRVRNKGADEPLDLSQYEAEATLYTRILGMKVRLSSIDPDKITLRRISDTVLAVNIPSEATARLAPGTCTIQLRLTHKTTQTQWVTGTKLLTIKHAI